MKRGKFDNLLIKTAFEEVKRLKSHVRIERIVCDVTRIREVIKIQRSFNDSTYLVALKT